MCVRKKRRTAFLTCTEEQRGPGKIMVAVDLAGSVTDRSSIAKLKSWAAWVSSPAFNAKCGKSQ